MTKKCHSSTLQNNPRHREEETQNTITTTCHQEDNQSKATSSHSRRLAINVETIAISCEWIYRQACAQTIPFQKWPFIALFVNIMFFVNDKKEATNDF